METQSVNNPEGVEIEQAADALATMGLKAEKELAACKDLGKIVPLPQTQEPVGDPENPKVIESENIRVENTVRKQVHCSACMKLIPNPISDGHGIVDGHVGQFRMLIPWQHQSDGSGFLCSRCYQRNWRLNKQRVGSAGHDATEDIPREPYKCLCGMTFQSSQLKAAHCRLCQKYREIADKEQRNEGSSTTPRSTSKDSAVKRPRTSSDHQGRRSPYSDDRKERHDGFLSPPPPIKIRSINISPASSFVSSFEKISTTPLVKPSPIQTGGVTYITSLTFQKLQLIQLLQTTRLLGQIDIVQYASLIGTINATNDPAIISELTQLVMQLALKPLVYTQQFIGNPPSKMVRIETESKPMTLLPSVFKLPAEFDSHTLAQAIK